MYLVLSILAFSRCSVKGNLVNSHIVLCLIFPDILESQVFHFQVFIGIYDYSCTDNQGRLANDFYLLLSLLDIF